MAPRARDSRPSSKCGPWLASCLPQRTFQSRQSFHAPERQVIRTGHHFALAAGADHVPGAVLVRAEKRAAAMDLLRLAGFRRVESGVWPMRITRDRARRSELRVVVGSIPVARPLPGVLRHV